MQRTVLVTGGTSGIGEAIALAFAALGDCVIATGVDDAEVSAFAGGHPGIVARRMDVSQPESVAAVVESLGDLSVLVNGAGILLREGREFVESDFARVIEVNLIGTMRMCSICRPRLAARRGSIVNVASMLSFFGSGFVPAYSASKGGVAQLTKSLAIAWAPDGIRVNAVAPGWIQTPMTAPLYGDPQRSEAILARTPLGRWGQPEDVAGAVLFLAAATAGFITGVILPVDGGYCIA